MRLPRRVAATLAALALLASGRRALAQTEPNRQPMSQAAIDSLETVIRERSRYELSDAVSVAAGLLPLRITPLAGSQREVRVWHSRGWSLPQLYRLVVRDGLVTGEHLLWWPYSRSERAGESVDDLQRFRLAGSCGDFAHRDWVSLCRVRFSTAPDWAGALREAEAVGLWELLDRPARWERRPGWDGWSVVVELRHGSRYAVHDYWSPGAADGGDQARVIALVDALRRTDALKRPSSSIRPYRGVTRGRLGDAFRRCGGGASWEFAGLLPEYVGGPVDVRLGGTNADTTVAERYVEVMAMLSPEWDARRRRSAFTRVLDVDRVTRVAPWTGRECP
jgi:hypothetical protein